MRNTVINIVLSIIGIVLAYLYIKFAGMLMNVIPVNGRYEMNFITIIFFVSCIIVIPIIFVILKVIKNMIQ